MTTIAPPPPATPASSAPPPLSPGGRTAIRAALVIAASVLIVGSVVALLVTAVGINSLRVTTDGEDLPGGMRSLIVDANDATVHVKSDPQTTGPRVELRTVNSTRSGPQRLEVSTDAGGTRIFVTPDSREFMGWRKAADVTVTLPPRLAAALFITTQQDDGTLIVDGDLDRLVANTTDGDIVLNGGARVVEITARDGDVSTRKPISVAESFTAEAVDGNVEVEFADAPPRRIGAVTRDGDVDISLPAKGPYLVRTQSDASATVRVPQTTDPAAAAAEVTVRSNDGNVVVGPLG